MCVLGWPSVFGWGGPVSDVREGCHRAGQTKAFPRVTPIRKVGPNDLAGRMAQKGARPRVGPIRKVALSGLDGALWPGRGRSRHFGSPLGRLGAFLAFLGGILALGHLLSVDLGAQNASFEHIGPENGLETRILSIEASGSAEPRGSKPENTVKQGKF